jgi:hypothetical protein
MAVWKLSIKPDAKPDYDPFELCMSQRIIGVGWSYLFEKHPIKTISDSYAAFEAEDDGNTGAVECLMETVKRGDFVWLHQAGFFYLCQVRSNRRLFGPMISADFRKYDLGHAREADWVTVSPSLVPGRVQRAVIAQRTIQRIKCSQSEEKTFAYIYDRLLQDANWLPNPDHSLIEEFFKNATAEKLEAILTSDDYEDMVAGYLQSQGWLLVKSTCFRSKPVFEFMMVRPGPEYAFAQVKAGSTRLIPEEYREYVKPHERIFLFSNYIEAANAPEGVTVIDRKTIFAWATKNSWALSPTLFTRIQIEIELERAHAA